MFGILMRKVTSKATSKSQTAVSNLKWWRRPVVHQQKRFESDYGGTERNLHGRIMKVASGVRNATGRQVKSVQESSEMACRLQVETVTTCYSMRRPSSSSPPPSKMRESATWRQKATYSSPPPKPHSSPAPVVEIAAKRSVEGPPPPPPPPSSFTFLFSPNATRSLPRSSTVRSSILQSCKRAASSATNGTNKSSCSKVQTRPNPSCSGPPSDLEPPKKCDPCVTRPPCVVNFEDKCVDGFGIRKKSDPIEMTQGSPFFNTPGISCCHVKPRVEFSMASLGDCYPNTASLKYRLSKCPRIEKKYRVSREDSGVAVPPDPLPVERRMPKTPEARRRIAKFVSSGEWKRQKYVVRLRGHKCPARRTLLDNRPDCCSRYETGRRYHCGPTRDVEMFVTNVGEQDRSFSV